MIREAIKKADTKFDFKYNNEEWRITYSNESLEIEVETGGTWMPVLTEEVSVRNRKDALKKAKKKINSFDKGEI